MNKVLEIKATMIILLWLLIKPCTRLSDNPIILIFEQYRNYSWLILLRLLLPEITSLWRFTCYAVCLGNCNWIRCSQSQSNCPWWTPFIKEHLYSVVYIRYVGKVHAVSRIVIIIIIALCSPLSRCSWKVLSLLSYYQKMFCNRPECIHALQHRISLPLLDLPYWLMVFVHHSEVQPHCGILLLSFREIPHRKYVLVGNMTVTPPVVKLVGIWRHATGDSRSALEI